MKTKIIKMQNNILVPSITITQQLLAKKLFLLTTQADTQTHTHTLVVLPEHNCDVRPPSLFLSHARSGGGALLTSMSTA